MKLPHALPRVGSAWSAPAAVLTFFVLGCGFSLWIGLAAGLGVFMLWHPRSPINPPETLDAIRSRVGNRPEC